MRVKVFSILLLVFLVLSCTDTSPTPTDTPLPTESQPELDTIVAPPEKVPGSLPESVKLESGYIVQLNGGLTEAGQSQLEAGETGYFLLAFADTIPLTAEGIEIGDMIDRGVFFTVVQPEALAQLQDWGANSSLRYAGPLPPEAKLSTDLAEEMKSIDPNERLVVTLRLNAPLDDVQRTELSRWLTIRSEVEGSLILVDGTIKVRDIPNLLSLPVIRLVYITPGRKVDNPNIHHPILVKIGPIW